MDYYQGLVYPRRHDDRIEIQFDGHASSDPKKCASYFSPSTATFTNGEVQRVIKKVKSIDLDGISMLTLKHLFWTGVSKGLNLSMSTLYPILNVWKVGRMVPLLKPGKPANKGESYRPITLTLGALLLSTFTHHLSLADHQHGFRKVHST